MALPPDRPLTLPQVAEAAGLEYRTLHTWVKRGLLQPSLHASSGAGRPSLFSFQDALQARILAHLRSSGIDLELIERIAEGLRRLGSLDEDDTLLLNGKMTVLKKGEDLDGAIDGATPCVVYRVRWASAALNEVSLA